MGQEETIRSFVFAKGAQGAAWSAVFALFCVYWLSFIPRLWIGAFKRDVETDNIKVIQIICLFFPGIQSVQNKLQRKRRSAPTDSWSDHFICCQGYTCCSYGACVSLSIHLTL